MTPRRYIWLIGHLVFWSIGVTGVAAQTVSKKSSSAPEVRTSLDRTAVWVADRVTFRVDIICPRGIDILEDDLSKDKLKLEGLDLVGSESSRTTDTQETTTHTFTYALATYRVDTPALKIGALVGSPGTELEFAL